MISFPRNTSNVEAKNLFHLELDGGLDIIDLTNHIVLMSQHSWEFTSLVQTWTQKTWDLFDQGFRSEESIVLLGELLDKFLKWWLLHEQNSVY